jgi:hypothetical protein
MGGFKRTGGGRIDGQVVPGARLLDRLKHRLMRALAEAADAAMTATRTAAKMARTALKCLPEHRR